LTKPGSKPKKFKIKDADQHPEYSDPESWIVWEDDDDDDDIPFFPFPPFFGMGMPYNSGMSLTIPLGFGNSSPMIPSFFYPAMLPLLTSLFNEMVREYDEDEDEDEFGKNEYL
jgi:hypothetical protein